MDVRIISDCNNSYDDRYGKQKDILIDLKRAGIPIKVNAYGKCEYENSCMHLKVSIIDDRFVATGSCNYSYPALRKAGNEDNLIVIPARVDKKIVERYKSVFENMWNDGKNYRDFN